MTMLHRFTCPQGHEWELPSSEEGQEQGASLVCPVCSALYRTPPPASGPPSPESEGRILAGKDAEDPLATILGRQGAVEADQPVHLGRYRITRVLGKGAFGVVYQGYDDELRRDVAIKVPYRRQVSQPKDLDTYLAEARILASLDHPHIVP